MSMIIRAMVQLNGDKEPEPHLALVFDDAIGPGDFITYRNALTTAAKVMVTEEDSLCVDEAFWLIQLAEFIDTALDIETRGKGGSNG